jgi:hypothetical protein
VVYLKEGSKVETWVKRIQQSKDKEYEINTVLQEIDFLNVTSEVKEELLEMLYQELALPPRLIGGLLLLNEQLDNKHYLDLIKNALDILKKSP